MHSAAQVTDRDVVHLAEMDLRRIFEESALLATTRVRAPSTGKLNVAQCIGTAAAGTAAARDVDLGMLLEQSTALGKARTFGGKSTQRPSRAADSSGVPGVCVVSYAYDVADEESESIATRAPRRKSAPQTGVTTALHRIAGAGLAARLQQLISAGEVCGTDHSHSITRRSSTLTVWTRTDGRR